MERFAARKEQRQRESGHCQPSVSALLPHLTPQQGAWLRPGLRSTSPERW